MDMDTDDLPPVARRLHQLGLEAETRIKDAYDGHEIYRLALWLFLYHESSDVLVHAELYHPFKISVRTNPIVKEVQVLGGSGTIGYVLRNFHAEAVADTFDDPRGTVAIQDTLIDNYSWCGVPIQDPLATKTLLGIVSFFPVSPTGEPARWPNKLTPTIKFLLDHFVQGNISDFVLLCQLASLEEANRTLTDVASSTARAPLHSDVAAMLRRVLALGAPFARLPALCLLEAHSSDTSTFRCPNSSCMRFDVRRQRVGSLRDLQWRAMTNHEQPLASLIPLRREHTREIGLIPPFDDTATLFVAIHSRSDVKSDLIASLFRQWHSVFEDLHVAYQQCQLPDSGVRADANTLKRRKILSEAAAALFGEVSLLILDEQRALDVQMARDKREKQDTHPSAIDALTVLLRFIASVIGLREHLVPHADSFLADISKTRTDLAALQRQVIALSLWHRVNDWMISDRLGFAGQELEQLKESGNWRVLQRAIAMNDAQYVQLYPPIAWGDALSAGCEINGLSPRTIAWPDHAVTFSVHDAFFPIDLHFCPAGFAENQFEENEPLIFKGSATALSLTGTKSLDGQFRTLANVEQRILVAGPISQSTQSQHRISQTTLTTFAEKELSTALLKDYAAKATEASGRAGVAAIMARNLSHNLGSHVLARHAVRAVKRLRRRDESQDGQFLDRYVQSRMDFVAQVATDWPRWTEPARLVGELLSSFLAQRIVLQEIIASEGIGALEWREREGEDDVLWIGKGVGGAGRAATEGEIRLACIGVRRDSWGREASLADRVGQEDGLLYAEPLGDGSDEYLSRIDLKNDPFVAIPGGVTGWHAFYVILENVIRNAAKHGSWKIDPADPAKRPLDVVVEFLNEDYLAPPIVQLDKENKVTRNAYLVRIYDNISTLRENTLDEINDTLDTPIIEATGELSRKHWGLAEMKIAALFLQGRTLDRLERDGSDTITGLLPKDDRASTPPLIDSLQGRTVIRAVRSPLGTLGYELYMLRPARLGISAD
jgi:hypothetical protein